MQGLHENGRQNASFSSGGFGPSILCNVVHLCSDVPPPHVIAYTRKLLTNEDFFVTPESSAFPVTP